MLVEIQMPRMGQSMEEGTVIKWLVKEGDPIKKGDPLAEIETDKAVITFESSTDGTIKELVVNEGVVVPVGTTLSLIEDGKEGATKVTDTSTLKNVEKKEKSNNESVTPADSSTFNNNLPSKTSRANASPLAKRLAHEMGVDLLKVIGSRPGGMISKEDVLRFADQISKVPFASAETETKKNIPLTKMKLVIAERLTQSKQSIPHFYVTIDVDLESALKLRESLKRNGTEVTINDLIIRGAVLALQEFQNLNSTFYENQVIQHSHVDMAIAVSVNEGLITPVIKGCDQFSLVELAQKTKAMVDRARSGALSGEDIDVGTFTISNLGMFGVKEFTAIINPPQVAILAIGRVQQLPVFDSNGNLKSAQIVNLTISADHRATDGVEAAKFLQRVKVLLEDGFALL